MKIIWDLKVSPEEITYPNVLLEANFEINESKTDLVEFCFLEVPSDFCQYFLLPIDTLAKTFRPKF